MKGLSLILLLVAYIAARPRRGRILGGQNAASGQFPFVVALNEEFGQFCDGVIIAPSWILTTAQCLYWTTPTTQVYVGSHLNLVDGTSYKMAERITHEAYDDWTYQNDIGLIRIDGAFEFGDTVQQIEFGEPAGPNATCTTLGWGETETEIYPENLQYVDVAALDMALCQNISMDYLDGYYLGTEQVCTLGALGQGNCSGDEGGPLVCDGKLAGIGSYLVGGDCGIGLPDVYTRPGAYLDWIQAHIQGF